MTSQAIGGGALLVAEVVDDDADGEAEEAVDAAHPFGVAAGEVVVDGDDVDALALEGVEVDRQGGDQRLAFAGLHLGDLALVQDHAALELDVEVPLAERPLGRLAHRGEGLDQQVVQRLAFGQPLAELGRLGAQRLVGELLELRLERIDLRHRLVEAFDDPVIGRPEQAAGERAEHENLDIVIDLGGHAARRPVRDRERVRQCQRKRAPIGHRKVPNCVWNRSSHEKLAQFVANECGGVCKPGVRQSSPASHRPVIQSSSGVRQCCRRLRLLRVVSLACAAVTVRGVVVQRPAAGRPSRRPRSRSRRSRQPKDPVVATVNGQPIYLSELEIAQQALPPQYRNMPLQSVFPALLERIINSQAGGGRRQEEQGRRRCRLTRSAWPSSRNR